MVLDPGIAACVEVDRRLRLPENETLDQPSKNFFKHAGSCLRGTIRPSGNLADQYMKQGVFGFPSFSGGDGGQGLGGATEAGGAKSAPLGLREPMSQTNSVNFLPLRNRSVQWTMKPQQLRLYL